MKKNLIAAVFALSLIGNAFAACDATPYNAPEELQPSCTEVTSVVSDALTPSADKIKAKVEIDSEKEHSSAASIGNACGKRCRIEEVKSKSH